MKVLVTGGSGFIGTNLVSMLILEGSSVLNVDWNPPLDESHLPYWRSCDIMDLAALRSIFSEYEPEVVVHLAARTDTDIYDLNGDLHEYVQNTEGTLHVLECIKSTTTVKRVVITSSMFVCEAGYVPASDIDYKPFTLYGVSKVITEQHTREAGLTCTWTIIRPQTIWGAWSVRYRDTMFKVMKSGLYFHPSKVNVRRAFGDVSNVVWQIRRILEIEEERVNKKTFYVGDRVLDLRNWVDVVSTTLTGRPVRVLPTFLVKWIARCGDMMKSLGIRFPITTTRFNSMTLDYVTRNESTFEVLGEPPINMHDGIRNFVQWYRHDSHKVNVGDRRIRAKRES